MEKQNINTNHKDYRVGDFEVMAPAGSFEALHAAIQAGADSVYFGVESLNMRAHSSAHFTLDDLQQIAVLCTDNGLKSYLAVNTVIYDGDIQLMHNICDVAKKAGISAIIASDVSVLSYCRAVGMEVHLSTQLNISNVEAVKFYAQYADVMVLARELNLQQVKHIAAQIEEQRILGPGNRLIRLEMFCHGALCMAISGKCYLSLDNLGYSANRGECMQVCRRGYIVKDRETDMELEVDNKYIMSPKDLKTIRFLDQMMDAGVRVFKIEGRARGPEYVFTVVKCYKEALQAVIDGTFTEKKKDEWDERLKTVFNRGFWNGYYLGQKLGEWNKHYGSVATEKKIYVGKGVKYFSQLQVGEFVIEAETLQRGDRLCVIGPTTGICFFTADDIQYESASVEVALKGQHISMKVPAKIRRSDKLFKIVASGRTEN